MIESEPIPAGENNYIRLCLIEDDYRIRATDLVGNILFELEKEEINKFYQTFTSMLLGIQELKVLEQQKEVLRKSIQNSSLQPAENKTKQDSTEQNKNAIVANVQQLTQENTKISQSGTSLELLDLHPRLRPEELQQCIRAIKEEKKLSRKVTVDGEDLEEYILQAFDGKKTTLSKIVNASANSTIAVLKEPLRRALENLVQEGKITSSQERTKEGIQYVLYAINYKAKTKKDSFDIILEKLGEEFTTEKFIACAKENGIQEEQAVMMLEQGHRNGEVYLLRPQKYKKIA